LSKFGSDDIDVKSEARLRVRVYHPSAITGGVEVLIGDIAHLGGVRGGSNMLWFLRKTFGTVALAWLALWLLFLVSCLVSPKAAGAAGASLYFSSIVGVPASIIWTVLKVISVLSAPRVERPVAQAVGYPRTRRPGPLASFLS
jgi:hypothetical protein